MKIKIVLLIITQLFVFKNFCPNLPLKQHTPTYIYKNKNEIFYNNLINTFEKFNINYEIVDTIDSENKENLYILFNVNEIEKNDLPPYYIVYQTLNLDNKSLDNDYLDKLSNAIAVWDYKWENVELYRSIIHNFYYFPKNYEYCDPVILPCFLETENLIKYKEILIKSNEDDNDISSHIPIIFTYGVLKKPSLIIEAGVALGRSTDIFNKIVGICKSELIGIDSKEEYRSSYTNLKNAQFLCMNDLDFTIYFSNHLIGKKIDIIFIDTSHLYDHTFQEITNFVPLLSDGGIIIFHDSNMSPLNNFGWRCLNNRIRHGGWDNRKGVIRAIKDYFSLDFDESKYYNKEFKNNNIKWKIVHYPFCNGLTILTKLMSEN